MRTRKKLAPRASGHDPSHPAEFETGKKSVEIRANQLLWKDRLEVRLRWFRNHWNDMIDFVRLPGQGNRKQEQNLLSAISQ